MSNVTLFLIYEFLKYCIDLCDHSIIITLIHMLLISALLFLPSKCKLKILNGMYTYVAYMLCFKICMHCNSAVERFLMDLRRSINTLLPFYRYHYHFFTAESGV